MPPTALPPYPPPLLLPQSVLALPRQNNVRKKSRSHCEVPTWPRATRPPAPRTPWTKSSTTVRTESKQTYSLTLKLHFGGGIGEVPNVSHESGGIFFPNRQDDPSIYHPADGWTLLKASCARASHSISGGIPQLYFLTILHCTGWPTSCLHLLLVPGA